MANSTVCNKIMLRLVYCSELKKRNTTSVVWDYFGLRANPDGSVVRGEANYPVCRSCGKSVLVKGGNTTNLLTHLRDRHPDLYAEASPKVAKKSATAASSANENRQPTLLQSIERSAKYGAHSSGKYLCGNICVCVVQVCHQRESSAALAVLQS